MGRIMMLIGIFLFINDGIGGFGLMICLILWLAIYYHAIDNNQRFDYFKSLSRAIMILAIISLYSLILAELNYFQSNHKNKILILTGTLTVYRSFKILSVIFVTLFSVLNILLVSYHLAMWNQNETLLGYSVEGKSTPNREDVRTQ